MPPRPRVRVATRTATTQQGVVQQGVVQQNTVQQPAKKRDPFTRITDKQRTEYAKVYYNITGHKDIPIGHDKIVDIVQQQSRLPKKDVEQIFKIADKNGNNALDYEEFMIMYHIAKICVAQGIDVPTSLPDAFIPVDQRTTQRKKIAIRTANATEVTDANVRSFLSRNDINVSFATIFTEAIKTVIKIEMNDNEFMTDGNIIFYAKIQQLEYFLQQQTYKDSLIRALQQQNINWIISILMQYDPQVYPEDWENETQRLTSSIIEKCEPNSAYECPRCHEKKVFATQRQVRSADEGTTSFFRCCNCGYIWQEN